MSRRALIASVLFLVPGAAAYAECTSESQTPVSVVGAAVTAAAATDPVTREQSIIDHAAADGAVSFRDADRIVRGTLEGGLTTDALKRANDFFYASEAAGHPTAETRQDGDTEIDSL